MSRLTPSIIALLATLMPAGLSPAMAETLGALSLDSPQCRAMMPGAKVGGCYLTIRNGGTTDDRLVSITSPAASEVQIHSMTMEGDVMKMAQLPDGLPVPASAMVELKPGGMHLMFMNVGTPFREGDAVKATLVFEKAGTIELTFAVGPFAPANDHSGHDMGEMAE